VTSSDQEPDEGSDLEELMAGFRATSGGATARFAAAQATIIRDLVGQIADLINDEAQGGSASAGQGGGASGEQGGSASGEPSWAENGPVGPEDLAEMIGLTDNAKLSDDPVLARLLPDAYRDDPDTSGEFRRYTEHGLRSGKAAAARTVLATLPPGGGRVRLSEPEAQAWLRALNDVRLALGVHLEVTDDFDERVAEIEPDDPRSPYVDVYQWLAFLQESLVRALS
jgi:hypothetical protein